MTSPSLSIKPRSPWRWRVLEANTLRAYTLAGVDFCQVTGTPIDEATAELARSWHRSMEARGFSVNTIRQRLSALRTISGVVVELPKRQRTAPVLLEAAQIRSMMSMVSDRADRMLLVRLLTLGTNARTVTTLADDLFSSHLIGAEQQHTLATQKVTRLLKRIASKAGLNAKQVNLRVWCLSGRRLVETLTPAELSSLLDARASQNADKAVEWTKALHGIGRRSLSQNSTHKG